MVRSLIPPANPSGTSSTKSERAFATLRMAGDDLVPSHITKLLGVAPTLAYAKGERYKRSPDGAQLIGRTGVWYRSTDAFESGHLEEHIQRLLDVIVSNPEKRIQLKRLLEENSLRAVMTVFWSGPAGAKPPEISNQIIETLVSIPVSIERDFDTDYQTPRHKHRASAS